MSTEIQNLLDNIMIDEEICSGKPIIKGTRITVTHILKLLASDLSIKDICKEYDQLTENQITASLLYSQLCLEGEIKGGKI